MITFFRVLLLAIVLFGIASVVYFLFKLAPVVKLILSL